MGTPRGTNVIGIALALGASLSWGIADYLGGATSRRISTVSVLVVSQPAALAAVVLVIAIRGVPFPPQAGLLYAVLAGAFSAASVGLMYRAMVIGPITVVAPIGAIGVAIPVFVGLARGERPTTLQLAGMVLAVGGVCLASYRRNDHSGGRRVVAGVGIALTAAVTSGIWFLAQAAGSSVDPYWTALIQRTTAAALIVALFLARRRPLAVGSREVMPALIAVGVGSAAGDTLFAVATTKGYVSVVSVLASLYPAVMVGLAAMLLRERLSRYQWAGVVAALAGVGLISSH